MVIRAERMTITGGFEAKAKGVPALIARTLKRALRDWHRQILPRHFQPGAEWRYGYEKRARRYRMTKERRGLPPLVFSGRTRSQAKALFRVTGSASKVRGRFFLPNHARMKPVRAGLPAIGEEMTRTTRDERRTIVARWVKPRMTIGLRKIRTRKVIKL